MGVSLEQLSYLAKHAHACHSLVSCEPSPVCSAWSLAGHWIQQPWHATTHGPACFTLLWLCCYRDGMTMRDLLGDWDLDAPPSDSQAGGQASDNHILAQHLSYGQQAMLHKTAGQPAEQQPVLTAPAGAGSAGPSLSRAAYSPQALSEPLPMSPSSGVSILASPLAVAAQLSPAATARAPSSSSAPVAGISAAASKCLQALRQQGLQQPEQQQGWLVQRIVSLHAREHALVRGALLRMVAETQGQEQLAQLQGPQAGGKAAAETGELGELQALEEELSAVREAWQVVMAQLCHMYTCSP